MLFNSYLFIFAFLPITLAGFALFQKFGRARLMTGWLVLCSLVFYGWWNPIYLLLLTLSTGVNFIIGKRLSRASSRMTLVLGIGFNLGLLGYFKYAGFFAETIGMTSIDIILPLAISFFTFQQIVYLADAAKGYAHEYNFLDYCLFITFFPQLIAGPIVHHKEMMPQFADKKLFRLNAENLAIGLTFFIIGLFKKVVIADTMGEFATPVFNTADQGGTVYLVEAWVAALAYTFQIYFDFSGYTDMAIGLARMVGIQLPLNFFSPYKAASIIDFWRRWHITLSRFLRDYLYIPLGGNKKGLTRRHMNIMITMLLGGLWHGAGWNFIIWGGLHGFYLVVNHAWRHLTEEFGLTLIQSVATRIISIIITFICIVIAWVFFRAETLGGALHILAAMAGQTGISINSESAPIFQILNTDMLTIGFLPILNMDLARLCFFLLPVAIIAFFCPNSVQFMRKTLRQPALSDFEMRKPKSIFSRYTPSWKAGWLDLLLITGLAVFAFLSLTQISEFLYFQF